MTSHPANNQSNRLTHILSTLNKYKLLWIIATILGLILSAAYAVFLRSETWSARQSLIVRDDLLGQSFKPGQFESLDTMKSAQETIFDIARKPQVIRSALQQLGPPSKGLLGLGSVGYPSEEIIEHVQGAISFSAPNGAEFGRTEVIILNTKSGTRERARDFTEVLVKEIISKVNEVRHRKFQSMEAEILQTCEAAESALETSKDKLKEMDQQLGLDAASMVAMSESAFRDDPLAREIAQLNLERRVVQSEVEQIRGMLKSLKTAKRDPEALLNISSDLTARQPALDSLKREMAQQKGAFALLAGRYTPVHPAVVSARDGINVMQKQIRLELANAESDTKGRLVVKAAERDRLDADIANLKKRMTILGEKRADSMTLFADIKKRTEVLNNARSHLAEIQGLASTQNADLLTKVDEVQVSTRPDGMGNRALILCGGLGGLMMGMGLVMLIAPPPAPGDGRRVGLTPNPSTEAPSAGQPVGSPLADIGLAKAESGLEASKNVLRNLMMSAKKNNRTTTEQEEVAQAKSQEIIDNRLSKAKVLTRPEVPIGSQPASESAPETDKPVTSSISTEAVESPVSKSSDGVKILPTNPFSKNLDEPTVEPKSIDPAELVKSATQKSSLAKPEVPKVEIPEVDLTEEQSGLNKMVDQAFEEELKSTSRVEAQTIQLDALSKALGSNMNPIPPMQEVDLSAPVSSELAAKEPAVEETVAEEPSKRGAQIKPRSANIRPVDLARQAQSDEFDRVKKNSGSSEPSISKKVGNDSTPPAALPDGNPFLKNRNLTPSASVKPSSVKTPAPSSVANSDASVIPVPDQIRKLSDSIASFATPVKSQAGSKTEKF